MKNSPRTYKGAHMTVILKNTIMASVRQGWQRNNRYTVHGEMRKILISLFHDFVSL